MFIIMIFMRCIIVTTFATKYFRHFFTLLPYHSYLNDYLKLCLSSCFLKKNNLCHHNKNNAQIVLRALWSNLIFNKLFSNLFTGLSNWTFINVQNRKLGSRFEMNSSLLYIIFFNLKNNNLSICLFVYLSICLFVSLLQYY